MGSWTRCARAPKWLQFWDLFGARARRAQDPFHTKDPFQWKLCFFSGVLPGLATRKKAFSVGGGGIKWPVQHRFCFTIDSVNDFDIDICLAVGFVRFRSHSKSFGFPIDDEIDDIPPKFERGPSTL